MNQHTHLRQTAWRALRKTHWDDWRESIGLTILTLVGGLAPLWIGWVFAMARKETPTLVDLARNGEFALYSSALVAPAFYFLVTQRTAAPFASRLLFATTGIVLLLLGVVAYCIVAPIVGGAGLTQDINLEGFANWTLGLFVASTLYSVVIAALENARALPRVDELVRTQQDKLESDFDRLNGGKGGLDEQ